MQHSPATLLEGMESYRKEVHVITTTTDLSPFASFVSEMRALSLPPSLPLARLSRTDSTDLRFQYITARGAPDRDT